MGQPKNIATSAFPLHAPCLQIRRHCSSLAEPLCIILSTKIVFPACCVDICQDMLESFANLSQSHVALHACLTKFVHPGVTDVLAAANKAHIYLHLLLAEHFTQMSKSAPIRGKAKPGAGRSFFVKQSHATQSEGYFFQIQRRMLEAMLVHNFSQCARMCFFVGLSRPHVLPGISSCFSHKLKSFSTAVQPRNAQCQGGNITPRCT